MAPPKRPWFRFYVETIWDRKVRRLSPEHRWLWAVVMACARDSAISGFLVLHEREGAMTEEDIADAAALRPAVVKDGLSKFERLGMIEWDEALGAWHLTKWNERQYESDMRPKPAGNRQRRSADTPPKEHSKDAEAPHDSAPPENREQRTELEVPPNPLPEGERVNPRANGTNPRAVAGRQRKDEADARQAAIDACSRCDASGWMELGSDAVRCTHGVEVSA